MPGRWHTAPAGKPIAYLAEHPALSLIESFVNFNGLPDEAPRSYQSIKVEVHAGVFQQELQRDVLPADWQPDMAPTQQLGDTWLAQAKTALLKVSSVPCPESWNYILNPLHADAKSLQIAWCRWIAYDNRVLGFRKSNSRPACAYRSAGTGHRRKLNKLWPPRR